MRTLKIWVTFKNLESLKKAENYLVTSASRLLPYSFILRGDSPSLFFYYGLEEPTPLDLDELKSFGGHVAEYSFSGSPIP